MTAAPQMPRTGFKFVLAVRAGPDKGAAFQLLPPRVTVGRNADNHVVLTDPRMSRHAATIDFSPEKITITDVSGRALLRLNGMPTTEGSLKNGDVLQIGDTDLVFLVEAVQLVAPTAPVASPFPAPLAMAEQLPPVPNALPRHGFGAGGSSSYTRPAAPRATAPSGRSRFYGMLIVIGLALAWLMTSSPQEKPKDVGIRSVEEIEKQIQATEEQATKIVDRRAFKTAEEKTRFEEAQKHYLEGFRDYQKGQWARAMRSFETARAIDPEHKLAFRYYRLAEKRRDEMISMLMTEGQRYKEKQMYHRCSAAFEKVLEALPNHDDPKYKSAAATKRQCDLLIEERFR